VGGWKRLHNEDIYKLYTSPNIITMIKSRRMRWVLKAAHFGKIRFLSENLKGRDCSEDIVVDGKITSE
jgi:hypothetical protein